MFSRIMSILLLLLIFPIILYAASEEPTLPASPPAQELPPELTDIRELAPRWFNSPSDNVQLSPDGQKIVRTTPGQICILTLANQQAECYPLPDRVNLRALAWSPDSRYLAFNEDVFTFIQESDLWVFDTSTGKYRNLTDDGLLDNLLDLEQAPVDYQPTWNPATGELYFFRTEFKSAEESIQWRVTLNRVSVEGGDVEEVQELTQVMPHGLVYSSNSVAFNNHTFGSITAISPDGSQMAVLVRTLQSQKILEITSVWLINLSHGEAPRKLVDYAALSTGLPTYSQAHLGSMIPLGLAWATAGQGLVVFSHDPLYSRIPPATMLYYIDVASGNTQPLMDFSSVTDTSQFQPPERDRFRKPTPSPTPVPLEAHPDILFNVPASAALSADGNLLYMLNMGWSQWGITVMALPPDGNSPQPLFTGEPLGEEHVPGWYSSTSEDRILLGYLLYEVVK